MEDQELKKALEKMAETQKRSNSLALTFLKGIVNGLGFFIGSAILAAVLIYVLSKIEGWSTFGGFIKQILDASQKTS